MWFLTAVCLTEWLNDEGFSSSLILIGHEPP